MMRDDSNDVILKPMTMTEKAKLVGTMKRIKELYPGPAGEILAEYVDSWKEFGYRLGDTSRFNAFIKQVYAAKTPGELAGDVKPADEWVEIS